MNPEELLLKYFGYSEFRPLQKDIVASIITGKDTLALLPTGGGKSICYQIPGLHFAQQGKITLVISPLIALMKDQVDHLLKQSISATLLNHNLEADEIRRRQQEILHGKYLFVYVSPERLAQTAFREVCKNAPIGLIAVDEAHCVSQWGHDFRPEYLQIAEFIRSLPQRPVVAAFTATAPPRTKLEIVQYLQLRSPQVFQQSFLRKNLFFHVHMCNSVQEQELEMLRLVTARAQQQIILYCSTRHKTEYVSELLRSWGIVCKHYHGGMEAEERTSTQEEFVQKKILCIAATNAFGMGIDLPHIRCVIHVNFPGDLEAYYQEAGRAGRDGEPAECHLLFVANDVNVHVYLTNKNPLKRKKIALQKLQKVIQYIFLKSCRQSFLLQYLGEKKKMKHCNLCDYCQNKKSEKKTTLRVHPQTAEYLSRFTPKNHDELLRVPGIGWGKAHTIILPLATIDTTPHLENPCGDSIRVYQSLK